MLGVHILMECIKYRRDRVGLFERVMRLGESVVSMRVLLGCGEHQREMRQAVMVFLYATGLHLRI